MINSRDKGARFERWMVKWFNGFFNRHFKGVLKAYRPAQYRGNTGQAADVEGVPFIHIEAKHQERMQLYKWYKQAVRDHNPEDLIAVIHKANNEPILVTMSLDDWAELYRIYLEVKLDGCKGQNEDL